ncbi:MAG: adenosylcobinamide-GDP ribazoletransferase [Lachnospiraceae bacterium]|nr:adenosylcobinamide-GDP ribazoletransferase [Lachnospiraceae bacterium]
MIRVLRWLAVAFSMYSRIPMPEFSWDEDDMAHSLTFFPLVGAVIGALVFALHDAPASSYLPAAVRILLTLLIPLLVTGGFHVDGLMDTADAMHSYASFEKKQEILKDPHIGAFAVISFVKWYLAFAAAVTAIVLDQKTDAGVILILSLSFVVSRCLCGLTSLFFPKAKREGMLAGETKGRAKATVCMLFIQLAAACCVMVYADVFRGIPVLVSFALFTVWYARKMKKEFGGVSGDTAGYFVTASEIVAAIVLAAGCLYGA